MGPDPATADRSTPSSAARRRAAGTTGVGPAAAAGGSSMVAGGAGALSAAVGGRGLAGRGRGGRLPPSGRASASCAAASPAVGPRMPPSRSSASVSRVAMGAPTGTTSPSAAASRTRVPSARRLHLHLDLVRVDLADDLARPDLVALVLDPGDQLPLLHGHGELGHGDVDLGHQPSSISALAAWTMSGTCGHRGLLEVGVVGDGASSPLEPPDRGQQVVEGVRLGDAGRDLGREPGRARGLLDQQGPAGGPHPLQDGRLVQRLEGAGVDHGGLDPALGQLLGGGQGPRDHDPGGHDGQVAALAGHGRHPQLDRVGAGRDRAWALR